MRREGKGALIQEDKSGTLGTSNDQYLFEPIGINGETAGTLDGSYYKGCGAVFGVEREVVGIPCVYDARGNGDGEICCTLTGDHQNRITDYTAVAVEPILCMAHGQAHAEILENQSPALTCNHEQPIIIDRAFFNQGQNAQYDPQIYTDGVNPTLTSRGPNAVETKYRVRRLTPVECERLQGYPDGYTDIGAWTDTKGKLHKESSDTARYKALGNSIALPQWRWVLERMKPYLPAEPTMASLFDGLGGFPLIWSEIYGEDLVPWCSEIEEFPIAVTKKRLNGE